MMRLRLNVELLFCGRSRMNTVLFSIILGLTYLPYRTSSAPAVVPVQNNGSFVAELLDHVQRNKCPFPVLSEIQNGSEVYRKVNNGCRGTRGVVESEVLPTVNTFLCVAVANLTDTICERAKESPELEEKSKVSMSIKTDMRNTAAVSQFCSELRKIKPKTEDLDPKLADFYKEFINDKIEAGNAKKCDAVCIGEASGIMEKNSEIKLNPVCILLKKELEILEALRIPLTEIKDSQSKDGENVNDLNPQANEESQNSEEPVNNPHNFTSKDKISKEQSGKVSSTSNIKHPSNVSPLPSEQLQGDDPRQGESNTVSKSAKEDEKLDSVSAKDGSPPKPDLVSKPSSTSTVSSADKTRVNPEIEEVEKPPVSYKPPASASSNIDKLAAQEQKPPTEDKSNDSQKDKVVSSSPASQTISSSTKASNIVPPQQKPPTKDAEDANQEENQKAPPTFEQGEDTDGGEIDGGDDALQYDDKLDKEAGSNKKPDSHNKVSEGVGSIPLESPNSPTSFDDVDGSGGYFNYFIFLLTIMALCFFAFHNKRRILAFVVEGRRPRGAVGRTRRRSSGSSGASYRRLENNFE